ncbi:MAG TPA: glutamate synthase central domain-containing protein, partial [Longimicrobiales bacterium]
MPVGRVPFMDEGRQRAPLDGRKHASGAGTGSTGTPSGQGAGGFPPAQGLYSPAHERDACGIGFVADVHGRRSHDIVRQGLELLDALSHRAAVGADPLTGDGAGVLLQLPDAFLRASCDELGITLPPAGAYGVGMLFLPRAAAERAQAEALVEHVLRDEGVRPLGWRDVPVVPASIGSVAAAAAPVVRQLFVEAILPGSAEEPALERALYIARRRLEKDAQALGESFYVASFSSRTIVYKGMLLPSQLPLFYPDLADERVESALALVHSRFSTNTFPSWARAHPYRFLCHNGEINTLRGNVNWMRVREGRLAAERAEPFGADVTKVLPVVAPGGSDSANLDNALEFLVMGGRSLAHAMAMLIPEAWGADTAMSPERRAFYQYHASLMEPWDGPAAVAFTDGRSIGAMLDRNGLRPARWLVTEDGLVVLASEAGVLPIAPERVRAKGRLQPGRMFLVDMEEGCVLGDDEVKERLASRRPYREWVAAGEIRLDSLAGDDAAAAAGAPIDAGDAAHDVAGAPTLLERQLAFGYTQEELKLLLAPMATGGQEPVGSMGSDTPLAVLSHRPQLLFKYFKQLFAQVTNPPVDPIREEMVMSLISYIGTERNILDETPKHCHTLRMPHPILTNRDLERLR